MTSRGQRSVSAFCREVLPTLARATDGGRILADAEQLIHTDRWNSFDRFHQTTTTLTDLYGAADVASDVYEIQTGGRIGSGRWIIPEAADVRAATVDIIRPQRRRLIDFRQNPWHVIQWSAATPSGGMTCELVVIDTPDQLRRIKPGSLAGKVILTKMPARQSLADLSATGAAGMITDRGIANLPDATPWTKFGWGGVTLANAACKMVGLVLSTHAGRELRELIDSSGPVTIRMRVDTRHYVGSHDLISGIVGGENPDEEVWALAHTAEPGAIDNASGVAACVEIGRILARLIAGGKLKRPRRSIRLLTGYECFSFFHYMENTRRLAPPLAGVCIDSLGAKPSVTDGLMHWHDTIPMSAGFVNDLGATIIQATLRMGKPLYKLRRRPFVSTCDTLVGDPKYGFPCPWVNTHFGRTGQGFDGYHSSADVPALLSRRGLATGTAAMAAYLYYLADAGNDDLLAMARTDTRRTVAALKKLARPKTKAADNRPGRADYLRRQHHTSMQRLGRWIWGGDRSEILSALAACEQTVTRATRDAIGSAKPRRARLSAADKRIPRRRVPITPQSENTDPPIAERIKQTKLPDWTLFWADGQRNLAEIAAITKIERNKDISAGQMSEFFQAHAELGYVDLIDADDVITKSQLVRDLKAMGVKSGMDIMLHSSLSRIGHVAGGAETVIDAILAAIGKRGTLLVPTFNFGRAKVYNPATTPGMTGSIPEALRQCGEAARSDHPTHSCAAIGPKAEALCRDHVQAGIWSADSPIGRLIHGGGFILSAGVGQIYSTAYHVAEVSMPCTAIDQFGSRGRVVDADGQVVSVPSMTYRSRNCPAANTKLGALLDRRGLRTHGTIGHAKSTLVKALDLWTVQRKRLKRHCPTCTIRPSRPKRP